VRLKKELLARYKVRVKVQFVCNAISPSISFMAMARKLRYVIYRSLNGQSGLRSNRSVNNALIVTKPRRPLSGVVGTPKKARIPKPMNSGFSSP